MKIKALILGLFLVGFSTATMYAQTTATPKATERQVNQHKRVKQGKNSGELTKGETAVLRGQQAQIQKSKKEAKSDGQVTKKERAQIQAQQNRASRNIYRKKHNQRDRN